MQKMKSGHSRGWNNPIRVNIKTKPKGLKTEEDYIDHFLSMRDTQRERAVHCCIGKIT